MGRANDTFNRTTPQLQGPKPTGAQAGKPAPQAPSAEQVILSRAGAVDGVRPGAATTVFGAKGKQYPATYAVVPRSLIRASHDGESYAKNPDYPLENTRDYSTTGEREKVLAVRNEFDPARHVTDSPDAAVGPSMVARVIGEDGAAQLVVLGGNNREMAIATMGPEKQQALADFTNERIDRFGVEPLKSPEEELVRFMGEFDLRKEGQRAELQQMVDSLNPSPGKVQNLAEMASVDAANGLPIEQLARVPMDLSGEDAQVFLANAIKAGALDRNLRSQIAEHPQQAAEYVRRLMVNAAYQSPELAEFHSGTDRKTAAARGLVESAVPALMELRRKGAADLADAFTRSMQTVVHGVMESGKLDGSLTQAAQQTEMDPRYAVVNEVAGALRGLIETNKRGQIDTDATVENFTGFWNKLRRAARSYSTEPDLLGEVRSPEDLVRDLIGTKTDGENKPLVIQPEKNIIRNEAGYEKSDGNDRIGRRPLGETGNLPADRSAGNAAAEREVFERVLAKITAAIRSGSAAAAGRAKGYVDAAYSEELAAQPEFRQISDLASSWGLQLFPVQNVPFNGSNYANIMLVSDEAPNLKLTVYHEGFHFAARRELPGVQDALSLVNVNSPAVQAFVRMVEADNPGYFDVPNRDAEIAEEFLADMFGGGVAFRTGGTRYFFSDGISNPSLLKELFKEIEQGLVSGAGRDLVPDFGAPRQNIKPRNQGSYQMETLEDLAEENGPYPLTGLPDMEAPLSIRFTPSGRKRAAKMADWQQVKLGGMKYVRPMEMPEILKLSRALGVEPTLKKLRGGTRGYLKPVPGGPQIALDLRIFKDPIQAAKTFAHEIGHLVDFLPDETMKRGNILGRLHSLKGFRKNVLAGETGGTAKEIQAEIYELSKWWRPFNESEASANFLKYRKSSKETYADALSVLLNSPAELKARAPKFWRKFFNTLEKKPEVKKDLLMLWDQLQRGESDLLRDRSADVRRMFGRGEEILLRKAKERELRYNTFRGWTDRFKMQYSDVYYPIVKRVRALKAQGKQVPWHEDPEMLLDEHPLAEGNKSYRFMDRLYKNIVQPLETAEMSLEQLGEYMFLGRVLNEELARTVETKDGDQLTERNGRQGLANPLGMQPAQARKQLLNMRLGLGIEKMTLLDDFARQFQDQVFAVVQVAAEVGTYSREYVEGELAANKYNYSTFAVLDHLEHNEHIPAGIRKQVGTLKDIANPFTATVLKMQTLMRWNQINKVHSAAIDVMAEWGEAERAPVKMAGGKVFPKPAPSGKVLFRRMVNGNPEHWYVDPEVPAMFEHRSPAEQDAILQALNTGFRKIIYPMWITYNPSFNMLMNPVRDFRRTHRNMPMKGSVTGSKILLEYAKNYRTAIRWLKHESDPLIAEMLENFAIGSPFDSFVSNVYRDDYFGKLMQKFRMMPEPEQAAWKQTWFMKPAIKLLKEIEFYGQIIESLPKIASYKILSRDLGWDPRIAAHYTRNYLGTPNYMKRGKHAYGGGTLAPFYNIFLRGWESDLKTATDPKTRFGFWFKYASTNGIPTILKALAAAGVLGAAIKEWFDGVSEYNKTNYDVIPLGKTSGGEFGRKSVGLRVPKDEFSRFADGVLYKAVYGMASGDISEQRWNQVFALGAGQIPGLTPFYEVGSAWTQYISGNNPYDYFYNHPVLTNDQWLEGGWEGMKGMIGWTAGNLGVKNYVRFNPNAESVTEAVLHSTPVLNKAMFISDYGFREQQQEEDRAEDRARAIIRNDMDPKVIQAKNEYYRLRRIGEDKRTPEQQERYENVRDWYSTEYSPAWEDILYYLEIKSPQSAKRTAKGIKVWD